MGTKTVIVLPGSFWQIPIIQKSPINNFGANISTNSSCETSVSFTYTSPPVP